MKTNFSFGKKTTTKNPLDEIEYSGNAENDSKAEMSVVETAFKKRAKEENKRFADVTDSEYWFAVCFQTREQKEEFLRKMNLIDLGDKYLDGHKAAKRLGVEIESENLPQRKIRKDSSWDEFVMNE